jgi:primosomal protein N' (replication factor Y)
MVYHKDANLPQGGVVRCHHCTAEQLLKKACPQCSKHVTTFGLGVQRVEEEVQQKLPNARVLRMDSDTMRRFSDYHKALEQFRSGELDLLIGTQMIAKGLDFPNVRVVGVISGDTSLNMPDFRAAERTFQLIAQVSGRAGRGEMPGAAVVQSFAADDPTIELASKHDYIGFATRELELRAETGLPPIGRMARIVVRDRDHLAAYERGTKLAQHLRQANEHLRLPVQIRGPMACPIARIADFHRQEIQLVAPDAGSIQQLMTTLRNARLLTSDAATAVDVDPVALL